MRIKTLITILIIIAASSTMADAVSIGVSPGRVDFKGMLKGGYAESTVTISTNSPQQIITSIKTEGEVKDWIQFEPNQTRFALSSSEPYRLKIIARPPKDIKNSSYSGSIYFMTEGFGNLTTRAGGIIRTGVKLLVEVETTGQERISCSASSIKVSDAEHKEPITVTSTIRNTGNVKIRPEFDLTIMDMSGKKLMQKSIISDEVSPTAERTVSASTTNQLEPSQYMAEILIKPCSTLKTETFDIVEKGTISDKGDLTSITNKAWAYVNENIAIKASFINLGGRPVSAQFKGQINREGKLVENIQSDEITAMPGQPVDLAMQFIPQEPGRYTITGRAIYNKKVTTERSNIININQMPETKKEGFDFLPLALYIMIIAMVILAVRKIRRRN
ncbi:hypothetical protein HYU11_04745 [Candidatus Woesearchaeota archaeon]|nr:hypothetical protein [Candidatus Woesearchaeota archaeon]